MPEGPEIRVVADQLSDKITDWNLFNIKTLDKTFAEFPYQIPGKVLKVYSWGKRIIISLDNDYCVYIYLGMDGAITWTEPAYLRITFEFEEGNIYYRNIRKIGNVSFIHKSQLPLIDSQGPCILSHILSRPLTYDQWMTIWKPNIGVGKKKICSVMVENRVISGIGNYLRSEILYRAKIRPDRELGMMSDTDWADLLDATNETMLESYESGGCTIKDFITPNGVRGGFTCCVYGREFDLEGNVVEKYKNGSTYVYFCPGVQV